jgi:hypothetical protein
MNKNRTNGKVSLPEQSTLANDGSATPAEPRPSGRYAATKLEFPTGKPDLDALRSATREWLVPLLVEKFLREQGVELKTHRQTASPGKMISDL